MPTGAVTLRSFRIPATVSRGFSSSFQTRISAGTIRLSRTEGSSKCGVTMAMSPSRGSTAAVRRSLRHHCTPVKYTIEAPGSMSRAPMPSWPMSLRALSMRTRYSSWPMGLMSPFIGLSAGAAGAPNNEPGNALHSAAPAPSRRISRRLMSVLLVGLLFDDGRAQQGVDALLDRRALVVGEVHGAGQLDEFFREALGAFLVADLVLDDPQFLVDLGEFGFRRAEIHRGGPRLLPGLLQQREFVLDVRHLGGIAHARCLDAQDGDLVEHFAGRNRYQE